MANILNKSQLISVVVMALLLFSNLLLIWQNLHLKSQADNQKNKSVTLEGDHLATLRVKDLNGNDSRIDFVGDERKQILLYFKTTCGFCEKQMKYWKNLVSSLDQKKFKVAAITAETDAGVVSDYVKSYGLDNWTVFSINSSDAEIAKLSVTPIPLVLDTQGKVEKVWIGMWLEDSLKNASEYFAIDF